MTPSRRAFPGSQGQSTRNGRDPKCEKQNMLCTHTQKSRDSADYYSYKSQDWCWSEVRQHSPEPPEKKKLFSLAWIVGAWVPDDAIKIRTKFWQLNSNSEANFRIGICPRRSYHSKPTVGTNAQGLTWSSRGQVGPLVSKHGWVCYS